MRISKVIVVVIAIFSSFLILVIGGYLFFTNHMLPGAKVGEINVGFNSIPEVEAKLDSLQTEFNTKLPSSIRVEADSEPVDRDLLGIKIDKHQTISNLRANQRLLLTLSNLKSTLINQDYPQVFLSYDYNHEYLASISSAIKNRVTTAYQEPSLKVDAGLAGKSSLRFIQGIIGKTLDIHDVVSIFEDHIKDGKIPNLIYETTPIGQVVDENAVNKSLAYASKFSGLNLTVIATSGSETVSTKLNYSDIVSLIKVDSSDINQNRVLELLNNISARVNKDPIEAKFSFDGQTNRALEFSPPEPGFVLDNNVGLVMMTAGLTEMSISQQSKTIYLTTTQISPNSALSNTNRLGINELLGEATSHYQHSIPNRVYNVALASSRVNGAIVPPGEEFSTNEFLGEVSKATGYKEAYVIKAGKTELGDGGGVCQVSSTLFRAALNAGFPITERKGHSYRVSYYEEDAKPGLDATVFAPTTDFKFKNDTNNHIVVLAKANNEAKTLTVKVFGTSDGRKSEISDHIIFDVSPPLPDVNIDDPTLKPGQVKQIDWSAPGAKAKFHYSVERNGEVIFQKDFLTIYQPWASVYLHGPR